MQVLIPANRVDEIKKAVTEATNARASVTDLKELYLQFQKANTFCLMIKLAFFRSRIFHTEGFHCHSLDFLLF